MKAKTPEQQLLSLLKGFLTELDAERAISAISLDASLARDLGLDSLGKVEFFRRVEKQFSMHLPENAVVQVQSLRDLLNLLQGDQKTTRATHQDAFAPALAATEIALSDVQTLVEALSIRAQQEPERPHIYWQISEEKTQQITYGQLYEQAVQVAKGLVQQGIQAGETVAIMLPTGEGFFYSFFACLLIGAIPVPIYPPFRPDKIEAYAKREIKILNNAEARLLITFAQVRRLSTWLKTFVPSLRRVVTFDDLKGASVELPKVEITADSPVLIQYTSGSTGEPKGVFLKHKNLMANLTAIGTAAPILPNDVAVSWLPLYHDMGLMSWLSALYFGLPITILSPLSFITRPEQWLWAIHYYRATISGGPNFAYELCIKKIDPADMAGLDLSTWRFAFNGAEAICADTMRRFAEKFAPFGFKLEMFAPVYGLAESTVALTFPPGSREPWVDTIAREAFQTSGKALASHTKAAEILEFVACGKPLPGHQVRIVDEDNQVLADRRLGHIQFKGPSAMQGYYHHPEATEKARCQGWWQTGDLGYTVAGELFVTGRQKDLIIKAGRNLNPEAIEQVVNEITGVRKGCVVAFGVADASLGTEKLIVVAEVYATQKGPRAKIQAAIRDALSDDLDLSADLIILAAPQTIPKTSSGKLQRAETKQAYVANRLGRKSRFVYLQWMKLACLDMLGRSQRLLGVLLKLPYTAYVALLLLFTFPFIWLCVWVLPKRWFAQLCRFWARNLLRLACCPLRLRGKAHLHARSQGIFVANHASYVDALLMIAVLPAGTVFVVKKELFTQRWLRGILKKLGYLTVDRLDAAQSLIDEKSIEKTVKAGFSIFVFPEGTFTYATGLRPFKLGAFHIAAKFKVAICPVAIQGTRKLLRDGQVLLRPGRLTVTVGEWITPADSSWQETLRLSKAARRMIAKHCGESALL